jgi:acetoin utilization deacetylase AcuC-like enzyme
MRLFYSPEYAGAAHAFETTRKATWILESMQRHPIEGVVLQIPEPLAIEALLEVHDPAYIEAVRTGEPRRLAESQRFPWDPGLWPMVLASNGGMVAAALAALQDGVAGSLSSGLHHARRHRGHGYCTFNGLVLAAKAALRTGASSVLILDLDAHCGGGTAKMIGDDPRIAQIDVSVCRFDPYEPGGRCQSAIISDAEAYLPTIERFLAEAPDFDLCLYNAGMDPHEHSDGGLRGITQTVLEERERLVFSWCRDRRIPVAFALAGGYLSKRLDREGLVTLHRLTIEEAARTRTT